MIARWLHDTDAGNIHESPVTKAVTKNNGDIYFVDTPKKRIEGKTLREFFCALIWEVDTRIGGFAEVVDGKGEVWLHHPNGPYKI